MKGIVPSPIVVSHGKAFGKDSWYTFYCPSPDCKRQIERWKSEDSCSYCGQKLKWRSYENSNS